MEKIISNYRVRTEEVKNSEGKRRLYIGIRNQDDPYDGILIYLTPAQAKELSKIIYDTARQMEQKR